MDAALLGLTPADREAVLHAFVGGGGAMLLAYAWFAHATERATPAQVRGTAMAGAGFLVSVGASVYLRDHAVLGPALSLAGCAVVVAGMRMLLVDRIERIDAARRRANGTPRD